MLLMSYHFLYLKSHWNQAGIQPRGQRREGREILRSESVGIHQDGRKIETSNTIINDGIQDTLDDKTTTNGEIHPET